MSNGTRPNVVLICVDQWRGDTLGAAGHPCISTPGLDVMALNGHYFPRAVTTAPSCVPARRCLMSGKSPVHNEMVGFDDRDEWHETRTLPHAFHGAGYRVYNVGKRHVFPQNKPMGFDKSVSHEEARLFGHGHTHDYLEWLDTTPLGREAFLAAGTTVNSFSGRPFPYPEEYHVTTWTAREAIRMIEDHVARDGDDPFFLHLSFSKPHPPWDPPQAFYDRYAGDPDIPQPYVGDAAGYVSPDFRSPIPRHRGPIPEARVIERSRKEIARSRAAYYGCIDHVDSQISRFAYHLHRFLGIDDVMYVFVSDHGEMLGDHHRYAKGVGYQGSINIPFIVSFPKSTGIREGQRYDDVACLEDVMPTLLDACGIPVPADVDGVSLMPLVRGEVDRLEREWLHVEHTGFTQCLTNGREKFLWALDTDTFEYYDLEQDPGEEHNLFEIRQARGMELHDALVARLAAEGRADRFTRDGRLSLDAVRDSGALTSVRPFGA